MIFLKGVSSPETYHRNVRSVAQAFISNSLALGTERSDLALQLPQVSSARPVAALLVKRTLHEDRAATVLLTVCVLLA